MFMKCREVTKDFFIDHPILMNHISLFEKIHKSFSPNDNVLFIKAPGRVNLIGEHTDYNMGPVLPCALDREIVFCLRENGTDKFNVSNVNTKFGDFHFSLHQPIETFSEGLWGNYVKAGIKGILDFVDSEKDYARKKLKGFDAIVSGNLPAAAGMSSSSALVVASAFSFQMMNGLKIDPMKLAEICAKAEHFVGTASGGMDQATSIMGKKNSFLKIDFNPLKVKTIAVPKNIQLIVFHSLIEAEKSGKARLEYNRRVLECRMAVDFFNQFTQNQFGAIFKAVGFIGEIKPEQFGFSVDELDNGVSRFLNQLPDTFSLQDITSILGLSIKELEKRYGNTLKKDRLVEPKDGFKIKGRFKHVFTECRRVSQMIGALSKNSLVEIGRLVDASHQSLANDYEVSTPEVENLIRLLKENGAFGARIMGAGFGGMVIAVTEKEKKTRLIENVIKDFYQDETEEDIKNYIFPCVPSEGASCLKEEDYMS